MSVTVILHERLGHWNRQLRPRLAHQPIRWHESRSAVDLKACLVGVALPVVLVDLARQPLDGLAALDLVASLASDARILVLDPDSLPSVREPARELGATLVLSGFIPPPTVAHLMERWIDLAHRLSDSAGWSRAGRVEGAMESWSGLTDDLLDPHVHASLDTGASRDRGAAPRPAMTARP